MEVSKHVWTGHRAHVFPLPRFASSLRCYAPARLPAHAFALEGAQEWTGGVDIGGWRGDLRPIFLRLAAKASRSDVTVMAKTGLNDESKEGTNTHQESRKRTTSEFLEQRISETLNTTGLDVLDVFMIDRPEARYSADPNNEELYAQLWDAVQHLEKERKRGRIQFYGVESNGFSVPTTNPHHLDFSKLHHMSQNLDTDNGFKMIGYPLNLVEHQAATQLTQENNTLTIAKMAKQKGFTRLSHRPLETYPANGSQMRLVSFPFHDAPDLVENLKTCWNSAIHLERTIPQSDDNISVVLPNKQHLSWAQIIAANASQINTLYDWEPILYHHVRPTLQDALDKIAEYPHLTQWKTTYSYMMDQVLQRFTWTLENKHHQQSSSIAAAVDKALPSLKALPTLQMRALAPLHEAADCVILGMHHNQHVAEAKYVNDLRDQLPATDWRDVAKIAWP